MSTRNLTIRLEKFKLFVFELLIESNPVPRDKHNKRVERGKRILN